MSWKILLEGPLADAAVRSVHEIADALEQGAPDASDPSYAYGHAGIALFFGYLAAAFNDERAASLADEHLEKAVDGLSEQVPPAGFFLGPTGVAWTNQHLEELLSGASPAPDMSEDLDAWIAETVRSTPWRGDYDLVFGLVGLGCYALDHPDRHFAAEILEEIVCRLSELALERGGRITWWTSPAELTPPLVTQYPDGCYNLGLAHGIAGVIGMLGRAVGAGFGSEAARRLLYGAVASLLVHRRLDDGGSSFPGRVAVKQVDTPVSCRSAWCYGDPGIAVSLLVAARSTAEPDWEREAIRIAFRDCARPTIETGVADATLCHGAAGLGHLYNRLYQATGYREFAHAGRGWLEKTLSMRRADQGVAGYANWWPETRDWRKMQGMLVGAAGIGLALISATAALEPAWDRPMLMAIPALS